MVKYLYFIFIIFQNHILNKVNSDVVSGMKDEILESRIPQSKRSYDEKGHILFFHHAGTTSHINVLKSLAIGLLEQGHQVTTAFYSDINIAHTNHTAITFKDRYVNSNVGLFSVLSVHFYGCTYTDRNIITI